MRLPLVPTRASIWIALGMAAAAIVALVAQMAADTVERFALGALIAGTAWVIVDIARSALAWHRSPLQWQRRLPAALAVGVPRTLACSLVNDSANDWWVELSDHAGDDVDIEGLPLDVYVPAHSRIEVHYGIVPRRRGTIRFTPARLRVRTLHGSFDWMRAAGAAEALHVYPDFAAVTRYAHLAAERRLGDIGIRQAVRRGAGTEHGPLVPYAGGEGIRHVDWKATLKRHRPVVRRFQDASDERVLFLLDCGRRMASGSHFDAALNALMLLAHVALNEGDAVGGMTFGTEAALARRFAPRKGAATFPALMALLRDVQPQATPSDCRAAAQELMQREPKRALVVLLTKAPAEDAGDLERALMLLRSRHRVMLVDAPPQQLAQALVSRYRAIKAAGPV
ncbi:DUF58 domain-containing protein [Piscinibacter sp. XHJ-5]|uniref:DUF58 domain-containing protein n=1 Tax=Piscinibacter sp. XHJ-5 TaxID=3037797 RepID=UPI002452E32D|nr:DUF58 domain-containing protein [Piscinibacter sp. XHJ-5]